MSKPNNRAIGMHKKTQKKSKFKKVNCSPEVEKDNQKISHDTCITPKILRIIQQQYNTTHPMHKITQKNPSKAWNELKNRLQCDKDECFLNQIQNISVREELKTHLFAPKHPDDWKTNPQEWLSNYDIMDVMRQYEKTYPEFKLIGPTTIDFDTKIPEKGFQCVLDDLCNFSLDKFIKAKKTKIGIVFNLDKYYQSGSHWVSMFIDISNKFIFFFDSADNSIPPEIWTENSNDNSLVNRIIRQGKELSPPIVFTFYSNRGVEHQRGNTECGMYSLFFIITMLTGKAPTSTNSTKGGYLSLTKRRNLFLKKRIPDEMVFQYRKIYFNE
jgi:hypothetical protein